MVLDVGESDGIMVGLFVGEVDEEVVGLFVRVGDDVGLFVADLVGDVVGLFVGFAGEAVGVCARVTVNEVFKYFVGDFVKEFGQIVRKWFRYQP